MNCVEKYKEEVCNVRNIEMNYYNVYYYCNIIDNLLNLFTSSIDWVVTGAQFTEPFFEEEIECFSKYSALHAFCDFAIRQLLFEEAEEQIEDIQDRYDNSVIDNKAKRLSVAFRGGEKDDCFLEVDRLFKTYGKKHESFFGVITTKCGLANGLGEREGDCRSGGIWLRSDCQYSENRKPSELPA